MKRKVITRTPVIIIEYPMKYMKDNVESLYKALNSVGLDYKIILVPSKGDEFKYFYVSSQIQKRL